MTTTSSNRRTLIKLTLTSVGIPVAVIGFSAWLFMSYRLDVITQQLDTTRAALIEGVEGGHLVGQARQLAGAIDRYVIERIADARSWSSDPLVVNAARHGAERHEAEGLAALGAEALEAQAPPEKTLRAFPETDRRLSAFIHASPYFAETFFTDVHGLNVATTNPTSDMLQSDEGWWQQAWHRGVHVGEVEYDESAAVWSVALSLRIDDPRSGAPLGVLKSILTLSAVQSAADRAEETLREEGDVQIADKEDRLIADTGSGHAHARIMQEGVGLDGGEALASALEVGDSAGLISGDHQLTAFARTAGGALYETVAPGFPGLDWTVVVREATHRMEGELAVLNQIQNALEEWRLLLAAILAGIAAAGILLAFVLPAGQRSGREGGG